MAKRSLSLRDAAWGHKGPGGKNRPKSQRRKLPADRAIHWVPREDPDMRSQRTSRGQRPQEFFLQRAALAGINRHVRSADGEPRFGYLLGYSCRCPNTGVEYSVVDTALAAREVFEEETPGEALLGGWVEARQVFGSHSGQLLGWYHSHHLLGLMLSEADEQANKEFFGNPWQASVIVVPGKDSVLGGVFRHDPSSSIGERRQPAAFYELLEHACAPEERQAASAMTWANYAISASALPEEDAVVPNEEDVEADPPEPESKSDEPPVRSPYAADRPVPLVIPGDGPGSGLFPAFRRRQLWLLGVFAMIMIFVALLTVARGLNRSPTVSVPQVLIVYTLEERRFFDSADGLSVGVERYAERTADFDVGRIGCDLLATGYVAADASFVRVAARYGELGANPKQEALEAYGQASTEIAIINTHFDGSGCPRP